MSSSPDPTDCGLSDDDNRESPADIVLVNGNADDDPVFCDEFETLSLSGEVTELDLYTCPACIEEYKQPRVLNCLHVFCEGCLKPLLIEDCIICPTCQMTTEAESISELPLDYAIANSLDMKGIEDMNMSCTSCKAKEKAISRCSDCANFLCPNCVTAHQFMRCFENHKVVSFEDITKEAGLSIHRPIICSVHGEDQPMKYFCSTCQIPICNECMMLDHQAPGHRNERICDIETREVAYMKSLVQGAQVKVAQYERSSTNLQQSLADLESQREDAKSLIQETFQSYKALLEKKQESLLAQLEQLHKQQELSIMEKYNELNETVDKIERGSAFVKRTAEKSNCLELLSLKKVLNQYMTSLLGRPQLANVSVDIGFVTDGRAFDKAVTDHFGHFKLRDESVVRSQQQQQQMHQIRQMERQASRASIANSEARFNISPPTLMQSASYSDMSHMAVNPMLGSPDSGLCTDNNARPVVNPTDYCSNSAFLPPSNGAPVLSDQLGLRNVSGSMGTGLIGDQGNGSQNPQSQSPTISDSGIGMDSNSPGTQGNAGSQNINLNDAMRLRSAIISSQGQGMLNNQMVPGWRMNDYSGINSSFMGSNNNMGVSNIGMSTTSSPDQDLHASHGSGMFSPTATAVGRSMVPSCGGGGGGATIEGVLGQRRESVSMNMASGGGSSGFTSPTPSQQYGPPFPLRGKMSAMQIRYKFGALGPSKGQFNSPHGFCMGFEEDIVVADTNNHRIQVFDKSGDFKYQFGIPGREEGQLWYPRKVAVMRGTSRYVICDRGNERSRMQIFSKSGHFVKKIAIRYIDIVAGLAITPAGNIVAVDSVSPTVFTISEGGDLIKWFDCSDFMREPSDIAVADKEYYVCDFKGHCVVVFNDDGQFQRRIGTDTITNFPNGIDISDAGDVLVGDSHGNRFHVAVFQRDGSLIGEFECPYVKVSRCCGLKITSEGYVVTLAKNNHHVLVLNTLYIS